MTERMTRENSMKIIKENINWIKNYNSSSYMMSLFDPVQTHAVYGLSLDDVSIIKQSLKKQGAKQFRLLKNKGFPILCFNAEKMI